MDPQFVPWVLIVVPLLSILSTLLAATLPNILRLLQERSVQAHEIHLAKLKHTQELEAQRLLHDQAQTKERLAYFRPIYIQVMTAVRGIEAGVVEAGALPRVPAEGYVTALNGLFNGITQTRGATMVSLLPLEIERGSAQVLTCFGRFVVLAQQIVRGLIEQQKQEVHMMDLKRETAQLRENATQVQAAIQAHLNLLQHGGL